MVPDQPIDYGEDTRQRVYICCNCGEDIREGDEYWRIGIQVYCKGCIESAHGYSEVLMCSSCGESIPEEDEFWYIAGKTYCKECIDDAHRR